MVCYGYIVSKKTLQENVPTCYVGGKKLTEQELEEKGKITGEDNKLEKYLCQ